MNTVTFQLSADTEQKLRDKARILGQTLEFFLQQLAETAVQNGPISSPTHPDVNGGTPVAKQSEELPKFISRPKITADELENLLDEFSAGQSGKVLPPDFSRADIYDDHD